MTTLPDHLTIYRSGVASASDCHDPRSIYAERFWLPQVGPTCWALSRRLSAALATQSALELDTDALARSLGVGRPSGLLARAFDRLDLLALGIYEPGRAVFALRMLWPPISPRMLAKLPAELQAAHPRRTR